MAPYNPPAEDGPGGKPKTEVLPRQEPDGCEIEFEVPEILKVKTEIEKLSSSSQE
jgi:hypothetical protein